MKSINISSSTMIPCALALTIGGIAYLLKLSSLTKSHQLPTELLHNIIKKVTGDNSDAYPLNGKVAIITGSSSGIGLSMAAELYSLGATVIVLSRTLSNSEKVTAKFHLVCCLLLYEKI